MVITLGIVQNRSIAGPCHHRIVGRLGHSRIAADQIGEPFRSDVIVISSNRVVVTIADIKRTVTSEILRKQSFRLVGAIQWKPVEREPNDWGVRLRVVGERRFHAARVFVIVIYSCLLWVAAA